MMERRRENLLETNRLLNAFVDRKFSAGMHVPEKAKKVGLTVTNYHTALRRLKVLGRITTTGKTGVLPTVLNASSISEKEYLDLGDPYARKVPRIVRRKYVRRVVKAKEEASGLLEKPLEFAVSVEDKREVTMTLVGPPDALASFLRRVGSA